VSATAEETSLPADIALGAVSLTVSDLDAVASFYERAVGLGAVERSEGRMRLGVEAGRPLVELVEEPDAPPPPRWSSGLFHLALLVPSRAELARAVRRVTGAGGRFTGASDHLVSEALYLTTRRETASRYTATVPGRSGSTPAARCVCPPWRSTSTP